jgi:hypothetical protein
MICFTPFFPQNDTFCFQQLSGEIEVIGAKHLEPKLFPAKYGITSIQIPEYSEARKDLRAPRAVELASLSRQRRVRILQSQFGGSIPPVYERTGEEPAWSRAEPAKPEAVNADEGSGAEAARSRVESERSRTEPDGSGRNMRVEAEFRTSKNFRGQHAAAANTPLHTDYRVSDALLTWPTRLSRQDPRFRVLLTNLSACSDWRLWVGVGCSLCPLPTVRRHWSLRLTRMDSDKLLNG